MKWVLTICFCTVALSGALAAADGAVNVHIKDEVVVQGPSVTLGEIADVTGESDGLVAQLSALSMGNAPWPGSTRRIDLATIRTYVRQSEIGLPGINWSGSPYSVVTIAARRITSKEIGEKAKNWVADRVSEYGGEVIVSVSKISTDCLVPARLQEVEMIVQNNRGELVQGGKVQVFVEIRSEERLWRRVSVLLDVQIFKAVLVARQGINRGEPVLASMVDEESVDVARMRDTYVEDLSQIENSTAARVIKPGNVLTTRMLLFPPAMRRGDVVTMQISRGSVWVTAKGVAKRDGRRGEVIPLTNSDSRRQVLGKIVDARTVEVVY